MYLIFFLICAGLDGLEGFVPFEDFGDFVNLEDFCFLVLLDACLVWLEFSGLGG